MSKNNIANPLNTAITNNPNQASNQQSFLTKHKKKIALAGISLLFIGAIYLSSKIQKIAFIGIIASACLIFAVYLIDNLLTYMYAPRHNNQRPKYYKERSGDHNKGSEHNGISAKEKKQLLDLIKNFINFVNNDIDIKNDKISIKDTNIERALKSKIDSLEEASKHYEQNDQILYTLFDKFYELYSYISDACKSNKISIKDTSEYKSIFCEIHDICQCANYKFSKKNNPSSEIDATVVTGQKDEKAPKGK